MKTSIFLTLVFLSGLVMSAQICNPNIVDNWKNDRYEYNNNGTVTDTLTKLMWKRCPEGTRGIKCSKGRAPEVTWKRALRVAEKRKFAGYKDWRLPNIKELASLVKRSCYNPSINKRLFPNMPAGFFWASSPSFRDEQHKAFQLNFSNGVERERIRHDKTSKVLLVRLGQ
ncbi:hypothetical protein THERMOT_739 [Bathymodiolus thermophilus thioautotrophic gill symbiont]|uniref:Lcl C-terminal domain-containing protein n=1 Tax=Bathymodiolus thermophilus thioautotrophic gill symbiont TaxID=2360 RepID=A0A1J5TX55_9GAMM|nr:DUF1566 domain-containing protein [Bathymodiolus thermophilus thioautotrophic gill symbiont]OIR25427.1 hypothetical protein BGC33_06515 [Bathymodiolus thermophilus thioautotrophic gill symbiont]CAB5497722.1 hypothetical protein THERMOT_739 [Bathymodiolus thermophilus thioautotrophic gill symbiont]